MDDKIFERIQALLRMAEDNANTNEAAVAAEKAALLIHKYNLDADAVRDWTAAPEIAHDSVHLWKYLPESWKKQSPRSKKLPKRKFGRRWPPTTWYEYGKHKWFVYLSTAVSRVCQCEAPYYSPGSVTFVGRKENVEQATFMCGNIFRRMMLMVDVAIKNYAKEYKAKYGGSPYRQYGYDHPSKFREGYLQGVAYAIGGKLFDVVRKRDVGELKSHAGNNDQALVVLKTAIDVYKAENFSYIDKTLEEVETKGNYSGYKCGETDGKNFTMQHGVGQRGAVKELGK